jgi:hypothetical protein
MPRVIPPVPTRDDQYFWTGVGEHKLLARKCAGCDYLQHPPSPMCPRCGSVTWTEQELAGTGSVYSWIVSHHPGKQDTPGDEGRIVALVELDEGIRLVANLAGTAAADVRNGQRVRVTFTEVGGVTLPQFTPEPQSTPEGA